MRELFFFAVGASIVGTIFFVSLVELIYTIRRRKVNEGLNERLKEIRASYTDNARKLYTEEETKLHSAEEKVTGASEEIAKEKQLVVEEYEEKIDKLEESSEKALATAKAKAKKLEEEAKLRAEEYLNARKKEVEQELMDLVIAVSKKVLPEGITYDGHKELVIKALDDIKAEAPNA